MSPKESKPDVASARQLGYRAGMLGQEKNLNPFESARVPQCAAAWVQGWRQAKRDAGQGDGS